MEFGSVDVMEMVSMRGKCPVCGKGPIKPLPLGYSVYVEKLNSTQRVGGLVAYQCVQELHLFFVMARDVEDAEQKSA